MRHLILPLAGVAAVALAVTVGISSHSRAQPAAVPLYHDLGDYHYGITTAVPLAQQYFDQGLRLYYAFNHAEAIRAFREAQRLDSDCAMCWWGEALSWGPNINLPMDTPSAEAAYAAIEQALARRTHASPREQALIDALATRYAAAAPEDRAHLDQAYADAMAKVVADFGDDHDIQVLYAEALMDLSPWDYWTGQSTPRPHIEIGLGHLEQVLTADEQHPGACHFYIHAVEEVFPERAVPCAERLARLMPGAGHLVHMPGHIYIRVGRYLDAVEANAHAVHADETYIQDQMPGMGMYTAGYYPHNYDFMAFAAMMIGRSTTAIDSAKKVTSLLPPELFGSPGMDFLQHWSVRPLHMQIRFARWQDILAQPQPQPQQSNLYALGIWHYARGRAFVGTGNFNAAEQELSQVRGLLRRPELAALKMEFNQSNNLLAIGDKVLSGWLAAGRGNYELAVAELEQAVLLEDALKYGEPPEWSIPTRQDLGSVLLKAGRPAAAENVFRQDLAKFPENGWSLHGLYQSLRDQSRSADAQQVKSNLDRVWATADVSFADL